jgi:hypothetical protein
LTTTATLVRQTAHATAVGATCAVTLTRNALRSLAVTVSATYAVTVTRSVGKVVAVSVPFVVSVLRSVITFARRVLIYAATRRWDTEPYDRWGNSPPEPRWRADT